MFGKYILLLNIVGVDTILIVICNCYCSEGEGGKT